MRENRLMTLALLGVIIGASGLGFGVYSTMQVQTGAVAGEDGDDGDNGMKSSPKTLSKIAWENNGTIICNSIEDQYYPYIVNDGYGGAIIVWVDRRTGVSQYDVYAQKINSYGKTQWGDGFSFWGGKADLNGTVISDESNDLYEMHHQICNDNTGGAIIVWQDERGVSDNLGIYAQHVDSSGQTYWGIGGDLNGYPICNGTGQDISFHIKICSDGNGGAFIVWQDERETDDVHDIYAQHIDSTGQTHWGENGDLNGTIICNAIGNQKNPQIYGNGTHGAIIVWQDDRDGDNFFNIYAQYIDSMGQTYWGENGDLNGTVICNAPGDQLWYSEFNNKINRICGDGNYGAIITWTDKRDAKVNGGDIYAQHINSSGYIQWGEGGDLNGTLICNTNDDEFSPTICSDNSGGAIIAWERGITDQEDIYIQRVNSSGKTEWQNNGTIISNKPSWQKYPRICVDHRGGAYLIWCDNYDIYAQWINAEGIIQWKSNGTVIANPIGDRLSQDYPQICSDDNGGVIIVWNDNRDWISKDRDIYAQYIKNPLSDQKGGVFAPIGDDDDDDAEDEGAMVIVIVIIVLASIGAGVCVVIILIKKGMIDISKLKRKAI